MNAHLEKNQALKSVSNSMKYATMRMLLAGGLIAAASQSALCQGNHVYNSQCVRSVLEFKHNDHNGKPSSIPFF